MKKENRIVKQSLCALFLAILAVAGCSSKTGQSSENASQTVRLTGAGSTFVYPIMSQWESQFQAAHPTVQINYQSIGSGGGIQQVKAGLVDFGASDAALDDKQLASMQPMIQIPESAGPVCITYNLPELKQPLRLTAAALSGIYLGTIKNWRDPAIAHSNPGVILPNKTIIVVHRSEGSGTTNIFTTYL
ncbi:MAG TPA: phosphate ABC transporter substrate-binding protein PstS, partial [Candidatus Angelobacter sp.]|nr:phosphate ABC transporter substrate-binding protein PstS [Candidatus Angelobacter sp.]